METHLADRMQHLALLLPFYFNLCDQKDTTAIDASAINTGFTSVNVLNGYYLYIWILWSSCWYLLKNMTYEKSWKNKTKQHEKRQEKTRWHSENNVFRGF